MDFITGLLMTWRQHDSIMVVVEKLTKATHFILVKSMYKTYDIANIFMKEIFKLHGLPKAIILTEMSSSLPIFGRVVCIFGYKVKLQHCIPSSGRWADRKS